MKRLCLVVALVLTLTTLAMPLTGFCTVTLPQNELERALENDDPDSIIRDYLFPYLEANPKIALLFAAELNISNGSPQTRDFGERGMFGKLVDSTYVLEHYEELLPQVDAILAEVKRLLLGPWDNGGSTTFSFASRPSMQEMSYDTGRWDVTENLPIIRVEHYTEYTNQKRVAYISCDFLHPLANGNYTAEFHIARTYHG